MAACATAPLISCGAGGAFPPAGVAPHPPLSGSGRQGQRYVSSPAPAPQALTASGGPTHRLGRVCALVAGGALEEEEEDARAGLPTPPSLPPEPKARISLPQGLLSSSWILRLLARVSPWASQQRVETGGPSPLQQQWRRCAQCCAPPRIQACSGCLGPLPVSRAPVSARLATFGRGLEQSASVGFMVQTPNTKVRIYTGQTSVEKKPKQNLLLPAQKTIT